MQSADPPVARRSPAPRLSGSRGASQGNEFERCLNRTMSVRADDPRLSGSAGYTRPPGHPQFPSSDCLRFPSAPSTPDTTRRRQSAASPGRSTRGSGARMIEPEAWLALLELWNKPRCMVTAECPPELTDAARAPATPRLPAPLSGRVVNVASTSAAPFSYPICRR
jgi:hypothetical protein